MSKRHTCASWRRAVGLALILFASGWVFPQLATAQSKETLLRNIAKDVIAPGYQALAEKCHAVTGSVEAFVKSPTSESLETARQTWVAALLASRQIQWLQAGPIARSEERRVG